MYSSGSNPSTSPASFAAYFEVSNRVIGPMPFSPACVAFHQASVPMPVGATTPTPVMTTRRSADGRLV